MFLTWLATVAVGGGEEASYEGHYALDFIPAGAQTPFPDVVWSYPGSVGW